MMKILLNLFPLGKGGYISTARTGVHRVVEHLSRGLAGNSECEVYFHALGELLQSRRYFEEHLSNSRTRFVTASWRVSAARHVDALEKFVGTTLQNRALAMRAARRAAVVYSGCVGRLLSRIDDNVLNQVNVYHSPFLPVPREVKRHPSIRRFTTVHDLIAFSHPQFFTRGTVRLVHSIIGGLNEEDYVTCTSEATRRALMERASRLRPERVFVTPLGAGERFHPESSSEKRAAVRARFGIPAGVPYLLSLCTFEPRKNLDTVIRAFARLRAERQVPHDLHLVLVGNIGWKTAKIFEALQASGELRNSIITTGFVPDDELAAIYSDALAFVYMSWIEGFGLPPLEAMKCGVPVITSNTSSLPEVVGDAGLMAAPDDIDSICAHLEMLVRDGELRHDLARRALERSRLFTWEKFIDGTVAAYRVALAHQA